MNKRIAKKKNKRAVEIMKDPKAHGLAAVMIINQACVVRMGSHVIQWKTRIQG